MIKLILSIFSLFFLFSAHIQSPQTSPEGLWRLLTITYQATREVRDYTNLQYPLRDREKKTQDFICRISRKIFSL
jgi:hypothetical protein